GQRPVVALAMAHTLALDGEAALGELADDRLAGRVVGPVAVPELRAAAQQVPFGAVDHGDRMLGRAADRLAAIQRRAMAPAVIARDRSLEHVVDTGEIFRPHWPRPGWRCLHSTQTLPLGSPRPRAPHTGPRSLGPAVESAKLGL